MCSETAWWITQNCHQVTEQTHALVVHLTGDHNRLAKELLALSTVVDFGECLEDFVMMYKVNRHWIFTKSSIF